MTPTTTALEQAVARSDLSAALRIAMEAVRESPGKWSLRLRLFQLYALGEQWEKARSQLQLAGELEAGSEEMVLAIPAFTSLLDAELVRSDVFSGKTLPTVFGEPPSWMAEQVEGFRHLREGRAGVAKELLLRAWEQGAGTGGTVDGRSVAWLMDADARFGPVLEAVVNGSYFWIPFSQMEKIEINLPENLHDRVWVSATLSLISGSIVHAYLPARYPGSGKSPDGALALGAETTWESPEGGLSVGLGQRFLASDVGDHPLLNIRRIEFNRQA